MRNRRHTAEELDTIFGPLRKFCYLANDPRRILAEVLECGHTVHVRDWSLTRRRRCYKCREGALPDITADTMAREMDTISRMKLPLPSCELILEVVLANQGRKLLDIAQILLEQGYNMSALRLEETVQLGLIEQVDPNNFWGTYKAKGT